MTAAEPDTDSFEYEMVDPPKHERPRYLRYMGDHYSVKLNGRVTLKIE
jgi:hypothetical protein